MRQELAITIVCDTIFGNLDKLKDGKEVLIPSNGVILEVSEVQLENGDTVFDALKRVCSLANIQLEYSYSAYESYFFCRVLMVTELGLGLSIYRSCIMVKSTLISRMQEKIIVEFTEKVSVDKVSTFLYNENGKLVYYDIRITIA